MTKNTKQWVKRLNRQSKTRKYWWQKSCPLSWNQPRTQRCIKHTLTVSSRWPNISVSLKTSRFWNTWCSPTRNSSPNISPGEVLQPTLWTNNFSRGFSKRRVLAIDSWCHSWNTSYQAQRSQTDCQKRAAMEPSRKPADPHTSDCKPLRFCQLLRKHLRRTKSF